MFKLFNKGRFAALLASLCVMSSSLVAQCYDYCDCNRFYIGGFGGGIYSDSTKVDQFGTAFFEEAEGGPLAVIAQGHTKRRCSSFGGAQVGYEWAPRACGCSDFSIAPAAELEALFYGHKKKGHLINPTNRLDEHDFAVSFKLKSSVILGNVVFSLKSPCLCGITPYVGGGIGAVHLSLKNARSIQVEPPEEGINHFNSRTHDTTWAFAAQVKAGVRYTFCKCFHVFAEYRYLFIDSSNYILGATDYPTHAPTSPWNVKLHDINYNAFAIGFQYDL